MTPMIYRHGDLLLRTIENDEIRGQKIPHNGEYILAYGEVTGHAHRLLVKKREDLEVFRDETGTVFLHVLAPARITHEEHREIKIQPGIFRLDHERTYDIFEDEMRRVVD